MQTAVWFSVAADCWLSHCFYCKKLYAHDEYPGTETIRRKHVNCMWYQNNSTL